MWLRWERGVLLELRKPELSREGFLGLGRGWVNREEEVKRQEGEGTPHLLNPRAGKNPFLPHYQLTV